MTSVMPDRAALAALIDHTLLAPAASAEQIDALCQEAIEHALCSVCVPPRWVQRAASHLLDQTPLVCTVIGFPHGTNLTAIKAAEATAAVADGADELDMVVSLGALRAGALDDVRDDIAAVVEAARGRTVKVILETATLEGEQLERGCEAAVSAGAHFVKTSTGFASGGATVEAVRRMRSVVGPDVGVKASGGIRDTAAAIAMIEAGANRIGASASLAILDGARG